MTWYIVGACAVAGMVTFLLRAVPFLALDKLRESRFVQVMASWMPAGILAILAAATFHSAAATPGTAMAASLGALTTAIVHLTCGRRTLLSVGAGTLVCVLITNLA